MISLKICFNQTHLSSKNKIELNNWFYFQFENGFERLNSIVPFVVLQVFS